MSKLETPGPDIYSSTKGIADASRNKWSFGNTIRKINEEAIKHGNSVPASTDYDPQKILARKKSAGVTIGIKLKELK